MKYNYTKWSRLAEQIVIDTKEGEFPSPEHVADLFIKSDSSNYKERRLAQKNLKTLASMLGIRIPDGI